MRVYAALLLLGGCCSAARGSPHEHARSQPGDIFDSIATQVLTRLDSRKDAAGWPQRIVKCGRTLGAIKCFKSFSAWRAENAIDAFTNDADIKTNLITELSQFPWERFANSSEHELGERLSDSAAKLLQFRSLSLSAIPGFRLELASKRNGTLNVDVCTSGEGESRGMSKKMIKKFYNIVPFLLLPGLLMSAVLPFVLPALKMMTVGVGMINQMALTGAIFTLLRNNAFNDKYHKKVIYVNEGYKNEKHNPIYADETEDVYSYHDGDHNKYVEMASGVPLEHGISLDYATNLKGIPSEWMSDGDSADYQSQYYKSRRSDKLRNIRNKSRNTFKRPH